MNLQFDPLSRNSELLRSLSATTLAGSEELVSWQIDSIQAFIIRSSQQFKAGLSDIAAVYEPATWQEGLQNLMLDTLKMSRDTLLAGTDYQMESMRLLQKRAAEVQEALVAALNEQPGNFDEVIASDKNKDAKRRLAA